MTIVLDETRVEAFVERVVDEIGAAVNVPLTIIGMRLGLYAAMADAQPVTHVADALRALTQGVGPAERPALHALAWSVGIVVVCCALSVRRFKR